MTVVCPICSGRDNREIERHNEYILYHCFTCDIVHAQPMKTSVSFYLNDEDYLLRDRLIMDPSLWDFRWDIAEFLSNPPAQGGNLLDVGCGTGFFVKKACEMGFNGFGIEFNERSVSRGRKFFHLDNLYALDIESFGKAFPGLKFRVVTLFQVLEHVENPSLLLSAISRLITKDASVIIALPLRERWPDTSGQCGDYPPHHLTRWSPGAMEYFLDMNGFYMKKCKVESFPLQNMPHLVYAYVLKYARFLTMKGSGVIRNLQDISEEQAVMILKKRRRKMRFSSAVSFPLWLLLRLLGARGPNFYVEACLKS